MFQKKTWSRCQCSLTDNMKSSKFINVLLKLFSKAIFTNIHWEASFCETYWELCSVRIRTLLEYWLKAYCSTLKCVKSQNDSTNSEIKSLPLKETNSIRRANQPSSVVSSLSIHPVNICIISNHTECSPRIGFLPLFIFLLRLISLMWLSVLLACISVQHVCVWFPQRSQQGIESPGTGILGSWEPVLGMKSGSSAKATSTLPHWVTSPTPMVLLSNEYRINGLPTISQWKKNQMF